MSASRGHAAAQDVFWGAGAPSTAERVRKNELEAALDGDETILEGLSGCVGGSSQRALDFGCLRSSLMQKTVTPTQRRSRALASSPLKAIFEQPTSSPASIRVLSTYPRRWQAQDLPRKSMALIDFEGKLASPYKENDPVPPTNAALSLLDDPFSPLRPAACAQAAPLLLRQNQPTFAVEHLISMEEQDPEHASPFPLQLPASEMSTLQDVIEDAIDSATPLQQAVVEDYDSLEGATAADTEAGAEASELPLIAQSRQEVSPSPVRQHVRRSPMRAAARASPSKANTAKASPTKASPSKTKAAPKVVLRAVDAMKSKQPVEKPSAAFASSSRSRIAQPAALRGPSATHRLPVASTSRLPGLAKSLLPTKPKVALSKSAVEVLTPAPRSPVKAAASTSLLEGSPKAPLTSTSKAASPGAVQRAAERVFGITSQSFTAPSLAPPQSPTRRPPSPRRAPSPKKNNEAVTSPKKASPRKPASPRAVAEAAVTAFGRSKVASPPEMSVTQAPARRKRAVTAPVIASPLLVTPIAAATEVKEAPAALPALTVRHTTRNALQFNRYNVIIDRRSGPRPPSPSARLRRQATNAARDERAKKRQALQETMRRASLAVAAEDEAELKGRKRPHARGAGDDGDFESPVKRRKQVDQKALKWDRGLYTVVGDDMAETRRDESAPRQGILKASRQLDQHGNALNAKAPLSPLIARESILITKIIYDDDEGA